MRTEGIRAPARGCGGAKKQLLSELSGDFAELAHNLDEKPHAAMLEARLEPFAGRYAIGHTTAVRGTVDRYRALLIWTFDDDSRSLDSAHPTTRPPPPEDHEQRSAGRHHRQQRRFRNGYETE